MENRIYHHFKLYYYYQMIELDIAEFEKNNN